MCCCVLLSVEIGYKTNNKACLVYAAAIKCALVSCNRVQDE